MKVEICQKSRETPWPTPRALISQKCRQSNPSHKLKNMTHPVVYSILGKTLKLDTAQDVQDIVQDINALPDLSEIRLSGNTLGVDAAKEIAKALKTKSKLSVISNNTLFLSEKKLILAKFRNN